MYLKWIGGLILSAAFTAHAATAATEGGSFAVYGWGSETCSLVLQRLDGAEQGRVEEQIAEWVAGYISAHNRLLSGIYDVTPVKSHASIVPVAQTICQRNPDLIFESVVMAILDRLSSLRLLEESPVISVTHNGASLRVNAASVDRIQEILVAEGFLDKGKADGAFSIYTAEALASWQQAQGLMRTGLPDVVTLFMMARDAK